MNESLHFKNHLVAYVDVLGFKNIIMGLKGNKIKQIEFLNEYLIDATIKAKQIKSVKGKSNIKLDIKIISDTFFFSIPCESTDMVNSLAHMAVAVGFLQSYLCSKGIWTRGAICFGELIRDLDNLVGPALIDSYLLESTDAIYPRVILDTRLLKFFNGSQDLVSKVNDIQFDNWQGQKLFYLNEHYPLIDTKFSDDLIFVDYFNGFLGEQEEHSLFLSSIDCLEKAFHEKPDIYKKHKWTQRYFMFKQDRISAGVEDIHGITQDSKTFISTYKTRLARL